MIFLSYILNIDTPTYGNRDKFEQIKTSSISKGEVANNTSISTTVHIGTHIDLPYHFYENGQTIEDFDANFWIFKKPLIIDIKQNDLILNRNLIDRLNEIDDAGYDILIVKTGICDLRDDKEFWSQNYGFHPDVYDLLVVKFPFIRVFGFDSISVSSIQNRALGRESHQRFLNPKRPILLLEDMDLRYIEDRMIFKEIIISPLRISNCDGLPCTVFGRFYD